MYDKEAYRRYLERNRDAINARKRAKRAADPEKSRQETRDSLARLRSRRPEYYKYPIVYQWVNPDGTVDYVGRGTQERAMRHRYAPWWTPQHILLTMSCESEWHAMEWEGKWGGLLQPRYNKEGYRHN